MALGLIALSFGLTVPSDVCLHGAFTVSSLICPIEEICERMLKACVAARMSSLIMPNASVPYLAAKLPNGKLNVYKGAVKVSQLLLNARAAAAACCCLPVMAADDDELSCWLAGRCRACAASTRPSRPSSAADSDEDSIFEGRSFRFKKGRGKFVGSRCRGVTTLNLARCSSLLFWSHHHPYSVRCK